MARTVVEAFAQFMTNTVNLKSADVSAARASKDNLLGNIEEFSEKDGFFRLWPDINIQFGSFARGTKCQPLDDIDLMIGISAESATYNANDPWDNITVYPSYFSEAQQNCLSDNGTLNSTKVLNRFRSMLEHMREYKKSEIHKNGEAVTLDLISKDLIPKPWSFDIVPCFLTKQEADGRQYYLIPNGKGMWKKTDPRVDLKAVQETDKGNRLRELIRLCKKWNKIKKCPTMSSYLLETLLVDFANKQRKSLEGDLPARFAKALFYVATYIFDDVMDMKGVQGNINTLTKEAKKAIHQRAYDDYEKALVALECTDERVAINKWREIFGQEFPIYG